MSVVALCPCYSRPHATQKPLRPGVVLVTRRKTGHPLKEDPPQWRSLRLAATSTALKGVIGPFRMTSKLKFRIHMGVVPSLRSRRDIQRVPGLGHYNITTFPFFQAVSQQVPGISWTLTSPSPDEPVRAWQWRGRRLAECLSSCSLSPALSPRHVTQEELHDPRVRPQGPVRRLQEPGPL